MPAISQDFRHSIKVGSMKIQPVEEVRNLGYFMDRFLKNSVHITQVISSNVS